MKVKKYKAQKVQYNRLNKEFK